MRLVKATCSVGFMLDLCTRTNAHRYVSDEKFQEILQDIDKSRTVEIVVSEELDENLPYIFTWE